jgi:hypothetical protein
MEYRRGQQSEINAFFSLRKLAVERPIAAPLPSKAVSYRILKVAEKFRRMIGNVFLNPNEFRSGRGPDPEEESYVDSE